MATINCSNCGSAFDSANSFCPFCGTPNGQEAQQAPTYAQPAAPQYPPYQPAPYVPTPTVRGKAGGGFGWIVFMRVILWILFAGMILSSLIYGIILLGHNRTVGEGLLVIFGGILTSFIVVAGGMILLNAASNLHKIATNSANILNELQKRK